MDKEQLDRRDWAWLEGTYWHVPTADLPAIQYDATRNTLSWIVDQTVWHITGYRDGYFWGACAVMLHDVGAEVPDRGRGSRPTGLALFGSITPEGHVQLTFVVGAALTSRSATTGVGRAVEHEGGIALVMQMSTGNTERTAHWARMIQTKPGDPSWDSLPGAGLSVPQMLDGIEPPTMGTG
jgi:hypothetical protein